ncbi:MAG: MBL fold metallo-hydrolase [Anaerolineae bacterium]
MRITFHGAAGTVTGSQHLIEVNGHRILLDCGLFQGKRKQAFERNRNTPFKADSIDLLILSHAHIDHSGNIPSLVRRGFRGDIIATAATRDLCAMMLADSAHIQERDVEYVNKKRARQGKNLFEPLYTRDDAVESMRYFTSCPYDRPRQVLPGVTLTMVDAGHMLGSATVILDIEDREAKRDIRLVFSGDIGRPGLPIIRDPVPVREGADILIMESTYGSRLHEPYPDTENELKKVIDRACQTRGAVLIPAFSVGRTQQIVYTLHKLYDSGAVPRIPIYVDSPLATNVTEVFRLHPENYDREIREFMLNDGHHNPFGFDLLQYTRSVDDSKRLNDIHEPVIIISASGMMEAGRILHHLHNRIEDPATTILIVGWQAPDTLGRRIMEHQEVVRIFGEEHRLRADVRVIHGFSGHADRDGLIAWAGAMQKKPARTFLVHGEPESAESLAEGLQQQLGFSRIDIPQMHQAFKV